MISPLNPTCFATTLALSQVDAASSLGSALSAQTGQGLGPQSASDLARIEKGGAGSRLMAAAPSRPWHQRALNGLAGLILGALTLTGCSFNVGGLDPLDGGSDVSDAITAMDSGSRDSGSDGGDMGSDGGMDAGLPTGPVLLRPAMAQTLPPTRAFLLWQAGAVPMGRTVSGYELCSTNGQASGIDDASECPNSATVAGTHAALGPLTPSSAYLWKARTLFDNGSASEWSALQTFSTDNSLIGWWRMDEAAGTSAADSSGLMSNGSLQNGPSWVPGIAGSAVHFDGMNDYILVGDRPALEGMSQLTLEAWIKTTTVSLNRPIVSKWFTGVESYILRTSPSTPGAIGFSTYTGAPIDTNGSTLINDGNWHYLTGTYDGAMQRLFVDLNANGSTAQNGVIANSEEEFSLGDYVNGTPQGYNFDGTIDEVAVYNRALSDAEKTNSFCGTQAAGGVDPLPAPCQ